MSRFALCTRMWVSFFGMVQHYIMGTSISGGWCHYGTAEGAVGPEYNEASKIAPALVAHPCQCTTWQSSFVLWIQSDFQSHKQPWIANCSFAGLGEWPQDLEARWSLSRVGQTCLTSGRAICIWGWMTFLTSSRNCFTRGRASPPDPRRGSRPHGCLPGSRGKQCALHTWKVHLTAPPPQPAYFRQSAHWKEVGWLGVSSQDSVHLQMPPASQGTGVGEQLAPPNCIGVSKISIALGSTLPSDTTGCPPSAVCETERWYWNYFEFKVLQHW